jgi:hypothetical protein
MLFNSFGVLAIESEILDLPLPNMNDVSPCNSTKVPHDFSRKGPN